MLLIIIYEMLSDPQRKALWTWKQVLFNKDLLNK